MTTSVRKRKILKLLEIKNKRKHVEDNIYNTIMTYGMYVIVNGKIFLCTSCDALEAQIKERKECMQLLIQGACFQM